MAVAQNIMARAVAPGVAPAPEKRMTYEEFLAAADEDRPAEWVDGKVIEMTPASDMHQDLMGFLSSLLRCFVEQRGVGVVRAAPFQMKSGADLPGREPDVMFIAAERDDRIKTAHMDGPADLVVEIISEESRARDRGEKFYEYEAGGVREYWLVDPIRNQAEFYVLDEKGIYQIRQPDEEGVFHSVVLEGLWLKVEWLWESPLPPLLDVLRTWGLI